MMKKHKPTEHVVQAPIRRCNYRNETEEPKVSGMKIRLKMTRLLLYKSLYGFVLSFFESVNRKAGLKLASWFMRCETLEHVSLLIKVFKWIVLPTSLFYLFSGFIFFGENALDAILLGILIFFYSSFLPDLPSLFRMKTCHGARDETNALSWYKTYVLLLLAPLFIGALSCGIHVSWKTAESFHNFKSLAVYEVFLFVLSFSAFGGLAISFGDIIRILSLPLYGLIGYMTHLKVDLCF